MNKFFSAFLIISCGILPGLVHAAWSNNPAVNNAVLTLASDQQFPSIASDGSDGAIITWQDYRNGNWDIYAQRVDANGVVQWVPEGVAISTDSNDQMAPTITSDGSGGAIITWFDSRGNFDIYAQRINAAGEVQWISGGLQVSADPNLGEIYPVITGDGKGGAIITWLSPYFGIYAQSIDANGIVQWAANGVPISTNVTEFYPVIVSDGSGGAIIAWADYRSGKWDLYSQKVDASGVKQWAIDGVPIDITGVSQFNPAITSDGSGGAIIAWENYQSDIGNDIYAQRVGANGVVLWTEGGISICSAVGVAISLAATEQESPSISSDNNGGAIISWQDSRSGISYDIYAQRVDGNGVAQWIPDGIQISTAADDQLTPSSASVSSSVSMGTSVYASSKVSSGGGGAIITWRDNRGGSSAIYAQMVNENGAFVAAPATTTIPVPTINEWGEIMLASLLLISALIFLRRRNQLGKSYGEIFL